MQKYINSVLDDQGRPIKDATVTVTPLGSTTLSTLYSDNGVTVTDNPVLTDANGLFFFYAADGHYTLTVTKTGIATVVIEDVIVDDPANNGGGGGGIAGVSTFNGRNNAVTLTSTDVTTALGFTPLQTIPVSSFNARTGAIVLSKADVTTALGYDPLAIGGVITVAARGFVTATEGQTVFTVPSYTMGKNSLEIFINGLLQNPSSFTETTTTSITLTEAIHLNDVLTAKVYSDQQTTTPPPSPPPASTRDPLAQPFDTYSIWNVPIGSGANYASAATSQGETLGNPNRNGGSGGVWAEMPRDETNNIILTASSPVRTVAYSSAGWGGNRCSGSVDGGGNPLSGEGVPFNAPMPDSFIIPSSNGNESTALLLTDGRTIRQCQPFARCSAGGNATALLSRSNWTVDLYSRGELGAHGGSNLSAIGGAIRVHELRPGQQGPKHALKVTIYARQFCYNGSPKFKWPAITADGYADGWYGTNGSGTASDNDGTQGGNSGTNTNSNMVLGSLLAIPPSATATGLGLETEPGRQILWTLQNYGAYIVDDTYSAGFGIAIEIGPNGSVIANMQNDYGITFKARVNSNTAWERDVKRLANALQVITNNTQSLNSANQPAGGGTPRVPFAPTIP